MNPFRKLKLWFIGDLLQKTDDVFERSKIELLYTYNNFFLVLGLLFYAGVISNGLWYHFGIITFGLVALLFTPFILKYKQSLRLASDWYVIQQTITSTGSVYFQEFMPDMSGPIWTLSFILFVIFMYGPIGGLLRTIPFIALFVVAVIFATNQITMDFGIPPEQQLPNQPFVTFIPFILCFYLVIMFVRTNRAAQLQIRDQKFQLENNNVELKQQRRDVTASINYARRIQHAVLPQEESICRSIPLSFILYRPKDIVSGDFFWFHEIDRDSYIMVCADCTGHGVPGAMMTVVGSSLLNQIVVDNKITEPAKILSELDKLINQTLRQQKEHDNYVQDGMDLSLVLVNKAKHELIFTSAKRPAIFIRDKNLKEIKGSKLTLGGMRSGDKKFEEIKMNFQDEDIMYFFTDGFTDQFGGSDEKKYSIKRLRAALLEIHKLPMAEQKKKLEEILNIWKGALEQVDDVLIMGIKF